jgi:hypothetical protein
MAADEPVPVLVLESINDDPHTPDRMTGHLRLGTRPLRVTVEFMPRLLEFIAFEEMPRILSMHPPSQRAVIMALKRVHDGDAMPLPHDLTADVRVTEPLDPFLPMEPAEETRLRAAADTVDVRVEHLGRTPPGFDPIVVRADLLVDGRPMTVRVTLIESGGPEPLMLCVDFDRSDPDRPMPTREQARAAKRAILDLVPWPWTRDDRSG